MRQQRDLHQQLQRLDGKGYKAYKDIRGAILNDRKVGHYAAFRRQELATALNRLRTLRVQGVYTGHELV